MKSIRNIAAVLSALVMTLAVTAGAAFAGETLTLDSVSEKNIDMPAQDELLMTFMEKHASVEAKMSGTVKSSSRGSKLKDRIRRPCLIGDPDTDQRIHERQAELYGQRPERIGYLS